MPGRPEGCFAQRYLTPFFPNALNVYAPLLYRFYPSHGGCPAKSSAADCSAPRGTSLPILPKPGFPHGLVPQHNQYRPDNRNADRHRSALKGNMRTDGHYPMKRSILAALLITVLTAPAAHGQAKLLKPEPIGNDVAPTTSEPPQLPPPSPRSATLGPPTSIPIPVPFSPEVPATGPPHQLKGREPAHGTKTAGVPDLLPPPKVSTVPQAMPEPVINGPQGRFWTEVDGLAWWVQSDKGPPALVTTRPGRRGPCRRPRVQL